MKCIVMSLDYIDGWRDWYYCAIPMNDEFRKDLASLMEGLKHTVKNGGYASSACTSCPFPAYFFAKHWCIENALENADYCFMDLDAEDFDASERELCQIKITSKDFSVKKQNHFSSRVPLRTLVKELAK
jgi:hypothetical protein